MKGTCGCLVTIVTWIAWGKLTIRSTKPQPGDARSPFVLGRDWEDLWIGVAQIGVPSAPYASSTVTGL